jgi:hypothetical protein
LCGAGEIAVQQDVLDQVLPLPIALAVSRVAAALAAQRRQQHLVASYDRPDAEVERRDPLAVLDRSADYDTEDRAALVEAETSA